MAVVSIAEAADLVGRDRKSLYRDIKKGRLSATTSATGVRQVDISELVRVYGEIATPCHTAATVAVPQAETDEATAKIRALEAEITRLRDVNAAQERNLADMRMALLLLQDKTKRRGWWPFR